MKRFAYFLIILAVIAGVAVFILTRPQSFAVGFQPAAANYPMMHAVEGGFFHREGLDPEVKVFQSATDALDALLAGGVFLDSVIPIQNIAAVEAERPGSIGIVALLLSDADNPIEFIVVPTGSPIRSVEDLSAKTIVIFPGTFAETLSRLTFEKLGVHDLTYLKLPPTEMAQAIRTGRADAGIVYEPVASLAELQGWGRILERGLWEKTLISPLVIGGYAYNRPAAKNDPDLAHKVWNAITAAVADAKSNPIGARQPLVKYLSVPPEVLPRLPSPRVELADQVDLKLIQQTVQFYIRNGILEKEIDLAPLLQKP